MYDTTLLDYDDHLLVPPPEHAVCAECAQLLMRTNTVLERLEAQLRLPVRAAEPPRPVHETMLDWLAAVCGGREAVERLSDAPLSEDGLDLPILDDPRSRQQLETVAERLDSVAVRLEAAEMGFAFRRALLRLWEVDPILVDPPAEPAQVAAGIAWAVLSANGLLGAKGLATVAGLKDIVGVRTSPATCGRVLAAGLRGFWPWRTQRPLPLVDLPDLEPLGYPDLLVGQVRRRLIRLRDQAVQARDAEVTPAGGSPR